MDEEMGTKSVDMVILDEKVDLIIGESGETIKQLQERSGAKMVVIKNDSNQEKEHLLRLTGDPFQIKFAKQLVCDLIAEKKTDVSEAFVDIMIPANKMRLIIDNGAETIKQLRKRFGVKMDFIENVPNQKQNRLLRITGDPSKIEDAKQLVNDLIAGKKIVSKVDIMIPTRKVGFVIGKGGETIKELRERTGTNMEFMENVPNQKQKRSLRITGDPSKIEVAKQLVNDLIAEKKIASGGSETFVNIMIPAEKVGLVIGKDGRTIKQLQERTGAKMIVIKSTPNQQRESPLRIKGNPSQIKFATRLVHDLIGEKKIASGDKEAEIEETGMEELGEASECHLSGTPLQMELATGGIEEIINTLEKEQLISQKSSRCPKNRERKKTKTDTKISEKKVQGNRMQDT